MYLAFSLTEFDFIYYHWKCAAGMSSVVFYFWWGGCFCFCFVFHFAWTWIFFNLLIITKLKFLQPPQHIISESQVQTKYLSNFIKSFIGSQIQNFSICSFDHLCLCCLQLERTFQLPPLLLCQASFSLLAGATSSSTSLFSAQSCFTHP